MNAASVEVTCEVVGTLNHYKMVKIFFELCALRGGGELPRASASARARARGGGDIMMWWQWASQMTDCCGGRELELVLALELELALVLELELGVVGT